VWSAVKPCDVGRVGLPLKNSGTGMQPQAKSLGHLEHGGETWIAIGADLVQQPIELAAHRLDQLPPHRRGEGLEGGGVDGHGG